MFKKLTLSWKNKVMHSINVRNLVKVLVRVHIFRFTTESTLERNPTKGRSVRKVSFRTFVFKLTRWPTAEKSPINVKNVKTPSVGFQVFKPIGEFTIERNRTNIIRHVRVSVRSHIFIIREFPLERIHTNSRSVGGTSGKAHIIKLL